MTTSDDPVTVDILQIKRMIPHRYPFLLIDRVEDMRKNQFGRGIKNVTVNEHFFEGHFPQRPVMPGVLIIEAMAQTSAVLTVHTLDLIGSDSLVYFMGIDACKFRKPVVPGDRLELEVTQTRNRARVYKFRGEAKVAGSIVAEADFGAMIMPPEDTDVK